ncbi:MAG: hypothetical protein ABSC18_04385 [Verrucomicrobiota bacterium]|jgi:hypothetical protein
MTAFIGSLKQAGASALNQFVVQAIVRRECGAGNGKAAHPTCGLPPQEKSEGTEKIKKAGQ